MVTHFNHYTDFPGHTKRQPKLPFYKTFETLRQSPRERTFRTKWDGTARGPPIDERRGRWVRRTTRTLRVVLPGGSRQGLRRGDFHLTLFGVTVRRIGVLRALKSGRQVERIQVPYRVPQARGLGEVKTPSKQRLLSSLVYSLLHQPTVLIKECKTPFIGFKPFYTSFYFFCFFIGNSKGSILISVSLIWE